MFRIDPERYRVVDLSFEVVPGARADRPFDATRATLPDDCFKYDVTCTHTHVGTHVELPAHYWPEGADVTAFPLGAFYGRGILLHLDESLRGAAVTADYCAQQLDLRIQPGDCVLCRNEALGATSAASDDLPYLTPDAAHYLAAHQIKLLGIDSFVRLSVDIPQGRQLHEILMGAGCNLVEFLDHLDELQREEFFFMSLPFKIRGMDSGWARAIAIEDL